MGQGRPLEHLLKLVPQPLMAVPVFLFVEALQPLFYLTGSGLRRGP